MVMLCLAVALLLSARLLAARALKLRSWLLPREGSLGARTLVALAGPPACVLALVSAALVVGLVVGVLRPAPPAVTDVRPGSAGERAGLLPGDRIVAVDGRAVSTVPDVQQAVQATAGRPFALEIERAGAHHALSAQAQAASTSYRLGVQLNGTGRYERAGPGPALAEALRLAVRSLAGLARSLQEAVQGRPAVEMVVPVALVRMGQQAPSRAHLLVQLAGPTLMFTALLGALLSGILLLAARPRR
jgi:regulator of sigma E protease